MGFTKAATTAATNYFSKIPFHLILYITSVCNARCAYCYYSAELNKNTKYELTDDEIVQIFKGLRHIPHLSISGGEPFLRKNIGLILKQIVKSSAPRVVSIPTNCSFPDKIYATFDELCSLYPDTLFDLHISLDGYGTDHDELRKIKGLFEKVVETNRKAAMLLKKHRNFGIKIVSVYSSFNQDRFEKLIDFIEEKMVFQRLIVAWPHGTCSEETKAGLNKERFGHFLKRAEKMNLERTIQNVETQLAVSVKMTKEKFMRSEWNTKQNLGDYCNAGKKIVVIGETGKVFPCEALWHELGNIREYDFNLIQLLQETYASFEKKYIKPGCHCEWGCAQNVALVTNARLWPKVLKNWAFNRLQGHWAAKHASV